MEDTYKILIGMTEDTLEVVDISDAHNIEMIYNGSVVKTKI